MGLPSTEYQKKKKFCRPNFLLFAEKRFSLTFFLNFSVDDGSVALGALRTAHGAASKKKVPVT
jgi:hypothetical protein